MLLYIIDGDQPYPHTLVTIPIQPAVSCNHSPLMPSYEKHIVCQAMQAWGASLYIRNRARNIDLLHAQATRAL